MTNHPAVPPAPIAPPSVAAAPSSLPSYELALNFNPEGLIEALANLERVGLEVEEYVDDNEEHVASTEYDLLTISDEVYEAGMALANLLADGGQLNGRDLVWLDDEGKQVFDRDLEEVMRKAAPWAFTRLVERYPAEVAREVERAPDIRARWVAV